MVAGQAVKRGPGAPEDPDAEHGKYARFNRGQKCRSRTVSPTSKQHVLLQAAHYS